MKPVNPVYKPLAILFVIITVLCLLFSKNLDALKIDHKVLLIANSMLFLLTLTTTTIQIKSSFKKSPTAFIGSISISVFLKLIVIAGSVFIYIFTAGEKRSIYAVGVAMFLYILYTIFEVKGILKFSNKSNARR